MLPQTELKLRQLSELGYTATFDSKPEYHGATHYILRLQRDRPTHHKFIVRGVTFDEMLTKAVREAEAVEANEIEEGRA